ncbi:TIGR03643 family protein [Candidatus Pelagibacter sp.]|uniref:TIGR03643 family protein n=1 Tax=Candidatus Pelagibacter sp. TaxID=2024849 RepID=UPI003F870B48
MKKKGNLPVTRVKNPEPPIDDPDWIIWAAWADRITFEEIEKKTGKSESEVIKIMRRTLKPSSFRLWRKRVNQKSIKHRKKFEYSRKQITSKIKKGDYL